MVTRENPLRPSALRIVSLESVGAVINRPCSKRSRFHTGFRQNRRCFRADAIRPYEQIQKLRKKERTNTSPLKAFSKSVYKGGVFMGDYGRITKSNGIISLFPIDFSKSVRYNSYEICNGVLSPTIFFICYHIMRIMWYFLLPKSAGAAAPAGAGVLFP